MVIGVQIVVPDYQRLPSDSSVNMCDNDSAPATNLAMIKSAVAPSDAAFPFGSSPLSVPNQQQQQQQQQVSPATLAEYQQRLQMYDYAAQAALRFRLSQHAALSGSAAASYALGGHPALNEVGSSFASLSPFGRYDPRFRFMHEEPKPQHSYIGLIAMAILSSAEKKMVLSDIYQHILDHYPYFRNRGPGWRNSIRHNLSLNDCFVKAGRSANGKGHYWAIHPANIDDFKKGDFRRRKAQRKVRKHMGLSVPDDEDSQSPTSTPTPRSGPPFDAPPPPLHLMPHAPPLCNNLGSLQDMCLPLAAQLNMQIKADRLLPFGYARELSFGAGPKTSSSSKRLFDVESLLAPDSSTAIDEHNKSNDDKSTDGHSDQATHNRSLRASSPASTSSPKIDNNVDSNCSSPSVSSSADAASPSLPDDKAARQPSLDQHQNSSPLASGHSAASLLPWQAQIQSLQNLHQINAGLMCQSLRPNFPVWAAVGLGNAPHPAMFGNYAMVANNSLSNNSAAAARVLNANQKP